MLRSIAALLALLTVAAPASSAPVDVYCDFTTNRVLGVVARGAEPPSFAAGIYSMLWRDTTDADLSDLNARSVPQARWRCSFDPEAVVEMTPEEAAALPAPGAEARTAAVTELERSLTFDAILRVVADEIARQSRPEAERPPPRTVDELRDAARTVIDTREPEQMPTRQPTPTPGAATPTVTPTRAPTTEPTPRARGPA